MPDPVILHAELQTNPSKFGVDAFQEVPVIQTSLIVIATSGSDDGLLLGRQLAESIKAALVLSGPNITVEHRTDLDNSDPSQTLEFKETSRRKLLVLVGDSGTAFSHASWYDAFADVLLVLPKDAPVTSLLPGNAFKHILKRNACFFSKNISECVPAIFSRVGLTAEDQRIFISYRRVESHVLAEQLFDALTHEGFDVFLDRFNIEPGPDFQRRLYQELAEKSMVLMLESEYLASSPWTQLEIDHCKKYRLGLYALTLPDAKPIKAVAEDFRSELKAEYFEAPGVLVNNPLHTAATAKNEPPQVNQWGKLNKPDLEDIVMKVKVVHDQALFRRRRYLRDVMLAALKKEKATGTFDNAGMLRVTSLKGQRQYSLWLTTRPPELPDFHVTHLNAAGPPQQEGVVVGPLALLEPKTKNRIMWLKTVCAMKCIDESQIRVIAARIAGGTL